MSDLDPVARRLAEDRLNIALPKVEALAHGALVAPLIRAALSVHAPEDVLTVDGFPILVNWGVASQSGAQGQFAGRPQGHAMPARWAIGAARQCVARGASGARARRAKGGHGAARRP